MNNNRKTLTKKSLIFFLIPASIRVCEVTRNQVQTTVETWVRHVTALKVLSMKIRSLFLTIVVVPLFLCVPLLQAETDPVLQAEVEGLVLQHYIDGINYVRANALGTDAISYLAELLHDQKKKSFWVNIIVTMGFIESPDALPLLTDFLEKAEGEVDTETFRALLSIPYAIGCIASSGDQRALNFLIASVDNPAGTYAGWSFGNKNVRNIMAEQSITGLAMSGRPEAKEKLSQLRKQPETAATRDMTTQAKQSRASILEAASSLIERFEQTNRVAVFNPKSHKK